MASEGPPVRLYVVGHGSAGFSLSDSILAQILAYFINPLLLLFSLCVPPQHLHVLPKALAEGRLEELAVEYGEVLDLLPSHELPSCQVYSDQVEVEDEQARKCDQQQKNNHQQHPHASLIVDLTHREVPDEVDRNGQGLDGLEEEEEQVEELVLLAYAIGHPGTVVVESGNALVATVAVLDPQRLVGLAYSAVALYVAYFFLDRVVAVCWQHLDLNLLLLWTPI